MSRLLRAAVAALDINAINSALAADAGAARADAEEPTLLVLAATSFFNRFKLTVSPKMPARLAAFRRIFLRLLEAGAAPRGTVPRGTPTAAARTACAMPLEAFLAQVMRYDEVEALAAAPGARFDRACDGACMRGAGDAKRMQPCTAVVDLLSLALDVPTDEAEAAAVSTEIAASLAARGAPQDDVRVRAEDLIPTAALRAAIAAGGGDVVMKTWMGRFPAKDYVMLRAILHHNIAVVEALLGAGVTADTEIDVFMGEEYPISRRPLVFAAAEEAVGESRGDTAEDAANDFKEPTRDVTTAIRAASTAYRTGGPAHRALAAILRVGVKRTINMLATSPRSGNTTSVLSHSAQLGDVTVLRMLLDAGADPNLLQTPDPRYDRIFSAESALENATGWQHVGVCKLLLERGADAARSPRALATTGEHGRADLAKMLLAAGAGAMLNVRCTRPELLRGKTPLMVACMSGAVDVAELFLDAGALACGPNDRPAYDDDPRRLATPMACALAGGGARELVDLLVARGAPRPRLEAPARRGARRPRAAARRAFTSRRRASACPSRTAARPFSAAPPRSPPRRTSAKSQRRLGTCARATSAARRRRRARICSFAPPARAGATAACRASERRGPRATAPSARRCRPPTRPRPRERAR